MQELRHKPMRDKSKEKRHNLWFYISLMIVPVAHYIIFYLIVNFNSISLAMKSYTYGSGGKGEGYSFVWFDNFKAVFKDLFTTEEYSWAFKNSLLSFLVRCFSVFLMVFFAYYIFKKKPGAGFFKTMLFLPSIVSPLILCLLFRYFVDGAIPRFFSMYLGITEESQGLGEHLYLGLLNSQGSKMFTLQFFYVITAFSSILIYCGAMSNINPSILEAAQLDGANAIQELVKIVFPLIFDTFVSLFTIQLAGLFTANLNLHAFYSEWAGFEVSTIGYKLQIGALRNDMVEYPYLSAMGLVMTIIICPIVIVVRRILNKISKEKFGL